MFNNIYVCNDMNACCKPKSSLPQQFYTYIKQRGNCRASFCWRAGTLYEVFCFVFSFFFLMQPQWRLLWYITRFFVMFHLKLLISTHLWNAKGKPNRKHPLPSSHPLLGIQFHQTSFWEMMIMANNGLMCYSLHKAFMFNNSPQCPIAKNWKIK